MTVCGDTDGRRSSSSTFSTAVVMGFGLALAGAGLSSPPSVVDARSEEVLAFVEVRRWGLSTLFACSIALRNGSASCVCVSSTCR